MRMKHRSKKKSPSSPATLSRLSGGGRSGTPESATAPAQVCAKTVTKISRAYLTCLEEEEFESLPAAVFVRGFVVQAAKALKLPHEKVASNYMDHYRKTFLK